MGLYAGSISPYLTAYYGQTAKFDRIEEMSLGGNLKYEEFLKNKWNWKEVVDLSS